MRDCRALLLDRLNENAPARIQLVTGPRQVGKTTLLLEIADRFGDKAVYAAGDEPNAALPGFWERCWADAEARAQEAARNLIRFGSYPGAFAFQGDFLRWRAYVRDAIIEPAIGRDVLAMGAVRRPALLPQVFAIAAGSPAQIVSLQKMQGQLQDRGALETVAHYLALLQEAYLVAPLEKYSTQAIRRRASPPKLVVLNNALLSAMNPDGTPDPAREPERFGFWVENACLAFAINQGQQVTYWREEPLEVDAIFERSWGNWAVEVKTGRFGAQDLRGLLEFCLRHPTFKPLVLCAPGNEEAARRLGIASISWEDFLIAGPPGR